MPPIEIGPSRPVGPVQVRTTPAPSAASAGPAGGPARVSAAAQVERSAALEPGTPPVDTERVAVIRRAVEQGSYPVIPTRIADAMIAAGMLLRSPQA